MNAREKKYCHKVVVEVESIVVVAVVVHIADRSTNLPTIVSDVPLFYPLFVSNLLDYTPSLWLYVGNVFVDEGKEDDGGAGKGGERVPILYIAVLD